MEMCELIRVLGAGLVKMMELLGNVGEAWVVFFLRKTDTLGSGARIDALIHYFPLSYSIIIFCCTRI